MSVDSLQACGKTDNENQAKEVEENTLDGTFVSKYTGETYLEWSQGRELGRRVCQGQGKMERKNGETYEGYFLKNKFHGKGAYNFAKNDSKARAYYIGSFDNGLMHGRGQLFW